MKKKWYDVPTGQEFVRRRKRRRIRLACLVILSLAVVVPASLIGCRWYAARYLLNPADPDRSAWVVDLQEQRESSVHEAAHAIVGMGVRPKLPVEEIAVFTHAHQNHTRFAPAGAYETLDDIMSDVVIDMAGRAADEIVNSGADDGSGFDLEHATHRMREACRKSGLCGTLTSLREDEPDEKSKAIVERCLQHALERARGLVRSNRAGIMALSDLIMAQPVRHGQRVVTAETFKAFLASHPPEPEPPTVYRFSCP